MQLKNKSKANDWTAAAATALLSSLAVQGEAAPAESQWQADAAVLYYGEVDRVLAVEPVIHLQRNWSAEQALSLNLVFDVLTGASHNGAAVIDSVQTFTNVSGGAEGGEEEEEDDDDAPSGPQVFAAGEVPLIAGFGDKRFAGDLAYRAPFQNPLHTYNVGLVASVEKDYLSLGVTGGFAWELNQRNTTVTIGGGGSYDLIEPSGGMPTPLASYENARAYDREADKQVIDTSIGLTQILTPSLIAQMNISAGWMFGYLNDPYKVVSVLDANNLPTAYLNEARPDSRVKQSIRVALKAAIGPHSLTSDYRYYWDDWQVSSHTLDEKVRLNMAEQWFVEFHGRWYQQSAANFFLLNLNDGQALPNHVSADYRLGDLFTQTYGLNVGYQLTTQQALSWRAEWYQQTDPVTGNAAANMNAVITQLSYSLDL